MSSQANRELTIHHQDEVTQKSFEVFRVTALLAEYHIMNLDGTV